MMGPLWNDLIPSTIYVPSEIPFMSVSNADPTRSSSSSFSSLRGRLLAGPLELATLAPCGVPERRSHHGSIQDLIRLEDQGYAVKPHDWRQTDRTTADR